MKISATLQGFEELKRTMNRLPTAVTEPIQRAALIKGAEVIRAEAAALAPRGSGAEHLADHIVIDALTVSELDKNVEVDPGTEAVVQVGPAKGFFYGYFLEYGTVKMRAQAFMRIAVDSKSGQAMQIALTRMWAAIVAYTKKNGTAAA